MRGLGITFSLSPDLVLIATTVSHKQVSSDSACRVDAECLQPDPKGPRTQIVGFKAQIR